MEDTIERLQQEVQDMREYKNKQDSAGLEMKENMITELKKLEEKVEMIITFKDKAN